MAIDDELNGQHRADADSMGPGPGAPSGWSQEPAESLEDDVRETRLIHRLLRLGGEIPEGRWRQIDAMIDRMLAREDLAPRDAIRIGQLQAARERVIAIATGKALDKIAADQVAIEHPSGPTVVRIIEVDDYYGSAGAAKAAADRSSSHG